MDCPTPGTCHPDFEDRKKFILDQMSINTNRIYFAEIDGPPACFFYDPITSLDTTYTYTQVELEIREITAPAPWTDFPFYYTWRVAMDKKDRYVATNSYIVPYNVLDF